MASVGTTVSPVVCTLLKSTALSIIMVTMGMDMESGGGERGGGDRAILAPLFKQHDSEATDL